MSILPDGFEGRVKVNNWLKTLSEMEASDEISETQSRQMLFDLDSSYNAMQKILHEN